MRYSISAIYLDIKKNLVGFYSSHEDFMEEDYADTQ
jgi:hypothetical protein